MRKTNIAAIGILLACLLQTARAQQADGLWHHVKRELHYRPDGTDFLKVTGSKRFNRALYGTNTAFRVEAGDLPEFALYLPGMGGNIKFGLVRNGKTKWLTDADKIETRYRPGSMVYNISDALLGGNLTITVLASFVNEAILIKMESEHIAAGTELIMSYGGVTGVKFSRDGDIGADPESSFYLKPEYCRGNVIRADKHSFKLFYKTGKSRQRDLAGDRSTPVDSAEVKQLFGLLPANATIKIADGNQQQDPVQLFQSTAADAPVMAARLPFGSQSLYFYIRNGADPAVDEDDLPKFFAYTEKTRAGLANRVVVQTPDKEINTLGAAMTMAADAIWENPSYMHGAVAWRMRLPGWRGAYVADDLGWHDRARTHFDSYALSQVTSPAAGPVVMDTALHLARGAEKMGTSMFSSGYISRNPGGDKRPHHYDMNLVFVDQVLDHFNWTGDTSFVRKMWPLLVRHLDWEKRNFDADGDGLYDAYAAIWASDALQYSGGGGTHSSAYNYRANKIAAQLARLIGEPGASYAQEADKILKAMNSQLWLKDRGWYAEYKDVLGEKLVHPAAGIWTVYHAIDEGVPNAFQSWQLLNYVTNEIPHVPVRIHGWPDTSLYLLSTTNWQPYTWSLNNVAAAEVLHMALAYWQGGQREEAYKVWKSSIVENMYFSSSPGNFGQISYYDALRGELFRDFADVIGIASRSLVEGLFGFTPDRLNNRIVIAPGFPARWPFASLKTPDIDYQFTRKGLEDNYTFVMTRADHLVLRVPAYYDQVAGILVNGKAVSYKFDPTAIGQPILEINAPASTSFHVVIRWKGQGLEKPTLSQSYLGKDRLVLSMTWGSIQGFNDPQGCIGTPGFTSKKFTASTAATEGTKTFFVQVKQGAALYWQPVSFTVKKNIVLQGKEPAVHQYEKVPLTSYFNDVVTNIFKNQYLSPRPAVESLQLPVQGIGNWTVPLAMANINDSGLRMQAGVKNEIVYNNQVPLETPGNNHDKNILFVSQWDNYPREKVIPLSGKASHAWLMMAGSTNTMQSRLVNGELVFSYTDGSEDRLPLRNPENWYPIEQDYYVDGYAFTTDAPKLPRVSLLTGAISTRFSQFKSIKGYTDRAIDGGAATILDLALNPDKELKQVTVRAVANDVVIGLMSLTLGR